MALKDIREERQLSQEELAKLSNVNQQTISRIENGVNVRFNTLIKLSEALDVSIDSLIKKREPK